MGLALWWESFQIVLPKSSKSAVSSQPKRTTGKAAAACCSTRRFFPTTDIFPPQNDPDDLQFWQFGLLAFCPVRCACNVHKLLGRPTVATPDSTAFLVLVFVAAGIFFPRVRTPCGRSAQVIIIEGKGKGENNTSTPKAKQKPTKQEHQTQPKGQRPNPPHLKVFPLYEGETGEKSWL